MLARFLKKQATVAEVDQLIAQHQQEVDSLWQKKADNETRIANAEGQRQLSSLTSDDTGLMEEIRASAFETERLQAERVAAQEHEITSLDIETKRLQVERAAAEEREFITQYRNEADRLQAALTEANKWKSEQKTLEEQLAEVVEKQEAAAGRFRDINDTIIQLRQVASEKGYTLPDEA
jgi:predicted  nucleic acid-binding Zn-ribbon protein